MTADPKTCYHCGQTLPSAVQPRLEIAHHGLEVIGLLSAIEPDEDCIIATIGACRIVFSPNKEVQLRPHLGQQIGTIMIDKKLYVRELGA